MRSLLFAGAVLVMSGCASMPMAILHAVRTATRVAPDMINRLCKLFRCSVHDLFEFIDDSN
ncbi:MAG: hypothetical protein CVU18_07310 [Betaproteobacteria bacterium HGW-Betaproteobacteria-12]|nr:MAG: hypothetical protein CVU18_07310 [Betaproteobacteria bacterium HGW-Betaproteobacteria-12]